MAKRDKSFERKWQIRGWILFIASALFYIVGTCRTGDLVGLGGSLLFLVACFVFLIPLFFSGRT